jgi:vitamin B12/bleomycin/antimicrobial peptide transport system ATP-binding/permease protein
LDLLNEKLVYEIISKSTITFISVGHRDSIQKYHHNLLLLDGNGGYKLFENGEKKKINY